MSLSLFARIGGSPMLDAAVEIFYKKVLVDPILKDKFSGIDLQKLHAHQVAFMAYAFGGPNEYAGRSMKEAHGRLEIMEVHFQSIIQHLKETLMELDVKAELIDEALAVINATRKEIVTR